MTDSLSCLEWDSNFFGKRIGSLILQPKNQLETELEVAKKQGYSLVYIFSQNEVEQDRINEFTLLDVGGQVKYSKTPASSTKLGDHNSSIVRYTENRLTSEIIQLAYLSGKLSRFRVDPFLPAGSFEKLYLAWLTNTLDQAPMMLIHIYYAEGIAVGMITSEWHKETCSIGLLAVSPSYQGLGIGTQLLGHLESLCAEKNILSLDVKTQLSNAIAQSLYLKNSFLEEHRTFLYHAHRFPNK